MPVQQYKGLSYEELGSPSEEAIVVLHGWGSSAEIMKPLAALLATRYRTVNVDLPGHGLAPVPQHPLGLEDHANLVFSLCAHLKLDSFSVVGHSNGGRIALHMGSEPAMSERISRLFLLSPSGIRRSRTVGFYIRSYTAKLVSAPFKLLPNKAREFTLDWLRHSVLWKMLGSSDYSKLTGVMRETFVQLVNSYVEDRLDRIKCPTLIIWGSNDEAIERRQIEIILEAIPDSGLVELTGGNHFAFLRELQKTSASIFHLMSLKEKPV